MESGMMKVVFSSIINGTRRDLTANETKKGRYESALESNIRLKPGLNDALSNITPVDFEEKTSREVFSSLINASNCANILKEKALDGYVTITPDGAILGKCLNC